MLPTLVVSSGLLLAQARPSLPLRPGTYVVSSVQCDGAPFAVTKFWNGSAFSDPHDSACTTKILQARGTEYRLDTVCRAEGDGTPSAPSHERARVKLMDRQTFEFFPVVQGVTAKPTAFRWCSAEASGK
jgi:hypothetical protein